MVPIQNENVVPTLFFRIKKGLQSLETLVITGSERGARSPDLRVMNPTL